MAYDTLISMSEEIARRESLADHIRAKGGTTAPLSWGKGFEDAVDAIDSNIFTPDKIPEYVKTEAMAVVNKVKAVQTDKTITFIAVSDNHHPDGDGSGDANIINPGNMHMAMAAKIIAYSVPIDFTASLGDHCLGVRRTDKPMLLKQLREIGGYLSDSYKYFPQFRTIGNHDTGQYRYAETGNIEELTGSDNLQELVTNYNEGAVYGSKEFGYCYRDFAEKKLRVIVMNTCELEVTGGQDFDTQISDTQVQWLANTIIDLNSKADAGEWSFLIMGHFPMDYVYMIKVAHLLHAYIDGRAVTVDGVTADFSAKNQAKFIANFHGHLHNFRAKKINDTFNGKPGTPTEFDAWEICTPNSCALYNNPYGVVNGINYHDEVTYEKTRNSAQDTSFVVNVIDTERQVVHSIHYGAGIDRTIGYAAKVYHNIQVNLTNVTLNNATVSVEDGKAYTATIVPAEKYTVATAKITMGGTDITNTALDGLSINIAAVTADVVITVSAVKPASYTNQVPISTDASGNIYNGTGYREDAWIYAGEESADTSGTHPTLTGFIPCGKVPYVIRVGGTAIEDYKGYGNSIHWYDANHKFLGTTPMSKAGTSAAFGDVLNEYKPGQALAWQITAGTGYNKSAKYFRMNYRTMGQGNGFIITINEPIE